jgi:hypothetical protein
VPGGVAVWLEVVPWGVPVLGAMVPQAATVSATAAPRITDANAGAKPADGEGIVDHFFVRLPKATHRRPPEDGQPPLVPWRAHFHCDSRPAHGSEPLGLATRDL